MNKIFFYLFIPLVGRNYSHIVKPQPIVHTESFGDMFSDMIYFFFGILSFIGLIVLLVNLLVNSLATVQRRQSEKNKSSRHDT